jgi:hypothetical protein
MSNSQVPFSTLGAPIGYVSKLSSSVVVQSIDGQDRLIKIGDPIFFGETVVTGSNGSVTITFLDKTEIVIGPYSIVEMSDEIDGLDDLEKLNQSSVISTESLQEAILSGADPTAIQQAPAAGGEAIEGEHRVDVSISRNNSGETALPDFGYDTDNSFLGPNVVTELKIGIFEGAKTDRAIGITASAVTTAESDTKTGVPRIVFESAGSDGIYNAAEIGTDGTVTATITVAGSEVGDTLTYTVGGGTAVTVILTDELIATGIIIEVSPDDSVVATLSDAAGNTSETEGSVVGKVDTLALAGTVTINNITADDVINATESGQTIAVTGTATGGDIAEGDTVTLEINGKTYTTTVTTGGVWSVDVSGSDLAADTAFNAVVTSSDAAGNTVNTTGSSTHTVDLAATAGTVSVNAITADDVINATESAQTIAVTGTATGGDIAEGDTVTLEINNKTYTTTVVTGGAWSVDVAGSDLAADTAFNAVVTSSDAAGNTVNTTGSSTHTVDLAATAGTVSVNAITADDVINATESGQTIAVTGTATGGDIAEGDTVTLEINSKTYTTTVTTGGVWTVDVSGSDLAADTVFNAVVTSSDAAGNTVDTTGSSTHTVDVKAFGQIDVDKIAGDSVVDADESATGKLVEITGYVGNDAMPGDAIKVTLDGVVIGTGTVSTDQNSAGKYLYSVNVLGSDLAGTTASNPHLKVTVTGEDAAGNAFSSENTEVYFVDTSVDVEVDVFVEDTNYDGTISADEEGSLLVGGWLESGGSVSSITITDSDGTVLTITTGFVLDDDGSWLYFENSVDVSSLTDGELSVVVNIVDNSGNSGSSDPQTLTKDSDDNEGVTYLSDTVSVDTRIAAINFIQGASDGTESDDDLRGVDGVFSDSIDGFGGDDVLIGGGGVDTLTGGAGDDMLIGGMLSGDDGEIDTLTGGAGEDIFILQGNDSLDVITDFNAQDDRLDLTALLTGLVDNPGEGAAKSAIEAFLSENIKVLDQSVEINGSAVATFGSGSDFDSDGSGAVNSTDLIRIVFNDQEYSINIDG